MNQDTPQTTVRFYVESDGSPLAYFPKETYNGGAAKCCYSNRRQDQPCHPDYIRKMKKATPEQYEPLKQELESIGYNLLIK